MDMDGTLDFGTVYREHAGAVYRLAYVLTGSRSDADDCTAEAFARAFAGAERIEAGTVRGYLMTIVRNLVASSGRRPALELTEPDTVDAAIDPGEGPEQRFALWQLAARAQDALAALAPAYRGLLLCALDGQNAEAIGADLGLSPVNVRVRLHRIRRRLSESLMELLP
jgi:RNA polymerase sigma factor (sigma-70 family)